MQHCTVIEKVSAEVIEKVTQKTEERSYDLVGERFDQVSHLDELSELVD